MKLQREFYIPTGARKVAHRHSDAVAYAYERNGAFYAMVFSGKARKPAWHYRFKTAEARANRVTEFFDACQKTSEFRAKLRADRKATPRGLEVGDVLSAMWGYDQTNVDYFEVTGIIGTRMVEIREIARDREVTGWEQGKSVPLPGSYVGEPMRRKASGGGVRVDTCRYASKMEPLAVIGGKPVFKASHWTSYA